MTPILPKTPSWRPQQDLLKENQYLQSIIAFQNHNIQEKDLRIQALETIVSLSDPDSRLAAYNEELKKQLAETQQQLFAAQLSINEVYGWLLEEKDLNKKNIVALNSRILKLEKELRSARGESMKKQREINELSLSLCP